MAVARKQAGNTGTDSDWSEVARVAYELFEQRGRAHGYDVEDWQQAQEIVLRRRDQRQDAQSRQPAELKQQGQPSGQGQGSARNRKPTASPKAVAS